MSSGTSFRFLSNPLKIATSIPTNIMQVTIVNTQKVYKNNELQLSIEFMLTLGGETYTYIPILLHKLSVLKLVSVVKP